MMKKAAIITIAAATFVLVTDLLAMGLMIADGNYDGVAVCAYIAAAGFLALIAGAAMRLASRKCPHCGKVLPVSGRFCPYCGGRVDGE